MKKFVISKEDEEIIGQMTKLRGSLSIAYHNRIKRVNRINKFLIYGNPIIWAVVGFMASTVYWNYKPFVLRGKMMRLIGALNGGIRLTLPGDGTIVQCFAEDYNLIPDKNNFGNFIPKENVK